LKRQKRSLLNLAAAFFMVGLGIALVLTSAFYISSFLTILGTALTFWGAILIYINPTKHVQLDLFNSSNEAIYPNIERILSEYKLAEKGLYLPPKNLQNIESSLIFIPKTADAPLPKPEENNQKLLTQTDDGIFLDPPGLALVRLFEKQLGTSFAKKDLTQLATVLPKLLIEDFELAEKVEFQTQGNTINVQITKSILNCTCRETSHHPQTHNQVGCLLNSALACVLAKTTGKPVIIQTENYNDHTKTLNITYQTREE
jgi:hypothetical protein